MDSVFQEHIAEIAERRLSVPAQHSFHADVQRLDELRKILASEEISSSDMRKFVTGILRLMKIDSGNSSNLAGKVVSTSLIDSKISLHYRKTAYWLSEMGVSFEALAESDEERSRYERTVALVNNLSEDKVLLALLENSIIRLVEDAFGVPLFPKDVYAKPSNPIRKAYQEIANQLYYDRKLFFLHFDEYLALARKAEREAFSKGFLTKSAELRTVISALEEYRTSFAMARNFNSEAFRFFRDPRFLIPLRKAGLPTMPFPTMEELSKDPFRASIFNYVAKMERRIRMETERKIALAERSVP